jgi:hypothetical protein
MTDNVRLPESATTHDEDGLPLMTNADFRAIQDGTCDKFLGLPAKTREAWARTKRWLARLRQVGNFP